MSSNTSIRQSTNGKTNKKFAQSQILKKINEPYDQQVVDSYFNSIIIWKSSLVATSSFIWVIKLLVGYHHEIFFHSHATDMLKHATSWHQATCIHYNSVHEQQAPKEPCISDQRVVTGCHSTVPWQMRQSAVRSVPPRVKRGLVAVSAASGARQEYRKDWKRALMIQYSTDNSQRSGEKHIQTTARLHIFHSSWKEKNLGKNGDSTTVRVYTCSVL